MKPRNPATVDDGLHDYLPVPLDVACGDCAANVLLPVDLLGCVGEQEVTGPRQRQVLDTDLEHRWIHKRCGANENQGHTDAAA